MFSALDNFGIDKITEVINEIYKSDNILEDVSISIFVALNKKLGVNECNLYQTISVISHITKLMLWILMNRTWSRIRPKMAQEQCGFDKDTVTRHEIPKIRISVRAIQRKRMCIFCFRDDINSFHKTRHRASNC